ncbi:MAG: gamma-glutamyltransferase, partial [Planctomycetota bacterium]
QGRAVSAVNSTYMPFGSKIVAHGFTLQNRGYNFVVGNPKHPNRTARLQQSTPRLSQLAASAGIRVCNHRDAAKHKPPIKVI